MDRRRFLQASAASLALSAARTFAVDFGNSKPRKHALIGCGWYGKSAMFRLLQVAPVEVVALCDVDKKMLADAAEMVSQRQQSKNKPCLYGDFRELLKQEEVDIVQVSTPDHWHTIPAIAAMKAGRDVYMEKPVSVDVVEAQSLAAAAKKYQRVVQVNMQRRSTPHLIEARDRIVREGKLGKVGMVEIYCYYGMGAGANPPVIPPPENLDYEMWTGPAPMRPFTQITHPQGWRSFMEYGNGIVGDMCVHMYDMVRWLLDLGWPKRISSSGGILFHKESIANISDTQLATFDHENFPVIWQHRTWGTNPDPAYPWGATIYGDKGTLKASVMSWDFIPAHGGEKIHRDVTYELEEYPEDKTERGLEKHCAPAIRAHWKNFLQAVDERSLPVSNINEGLISAASCIMANLALKTGRTLAWDAEKGQVIGDEEANRLLQRPYREPWVHPTPETV